MTASQQRAMSLGRDIAAPLDDLRPVRREDDRRRPAPVAIAARRDPGLASWSTRTVHVLGFEKRNDLGILIGRLLHHMAPMAPDGLEIENDEAVLGLCAREQVRTPLAPRQLLFRESAWNEEAHEYQSKTGPAHRRPLP